MARRAKNEGTIYKRTKTYKGKEYTYWEAQVAVGYNQGNGNRIRKTITGSTQKEVKAKMQEAAVAIANNDYFEPSTATLGEWIDNWLILYRSSIKYQTFKHYEAQCRTHIKPALGAIKLSELTTEQIQNFYHDLEKSGHAISKKNPKTKETITYKVPLSPKSIQNIHGVLSKCLNTAVKLKYLKYNPASLASTPKVDPPEISPLSNEQVKLFLELLEQEELSDLFKVIIFTGLREAEAMGLTWDCVNFESRTIRINKQMQKRIRKDGGYTLAPVKKDKPRTLVITPYVLNALQHQKQIQEEQINSSRGNWRSFAYNGKKVALVFTQGLGDPIPPQKIYRHYKKMAKELGIAESRVHDLRHTFAVLSLQNGGDYKTLQQNLGHASSAFTLDIYGHATSKMQEESASKLQDFIDKL